MHPKPCFQKNIADRTAPNLIPYDSEKEGEHFGSK